MFDAEKKQNAVNTLEDMCFRCGENHTDECPLSKAKVATKAIPTEA